VGDLALYVLFKLTWILTRGGGPGDLVNLNLVSYTTLSKVFFLVLMCYVETGLMAFYSWQELITDGLTPTYLNTYCIPHAHFTLQS
jgi:hypothetical protein